MLSAMYLKEQQYIRSFYDPKEHLFVKAYTRLNRNFECNSSQRVESIHPDAKKMTSRQTPAGTAAIRIDDQVKKKTMMYELELNGQRAFLPRPLQHDRRSFRCIDSYLTHYALQRIFGQWVEAKK